ncbi:MAG TPA: hypothetical protein VJH23_06100 [archaeon]|nr:hypothetical protein [archaeon]
MSSVPQKHRLRQPSTVVGNIMHIRTTGDPRRSLTGNYRVSNSVIGVNVKDSKGKIRPKLFRKVLKLRGL